MARKGLRYKLPRNRTLGNQSEPDAADCCRAVVNGLEQVCKACVDCQCQEGESLETGTPAGNSAPGAAGIAGKGTGQRQ